MAVDQRILNQMKHQPQPELLEEHEPEAPLPKDQHPGCVTLKGTWKQRKWAIDLRNKALALDWHKTQRSMLMIVTDATWWIANKAIVNTMKFKPPTAEQMVAAPAPAATTVIANALAGNAERARERKADAERLNEAAKFAESVSKDPKLAEAAILAVLSRLYKDGQLKEQMRRAARAAMEQADHDDADPRDIDAINRMLS